MREVRPRHRSPARRTSPCLVPPRGLVGVRARPVEGGGVGWLGTPAGTGRHAHRQPQAPPAPDDLIHVLLLCHYSNHSCEKGLAYGYSNSVHQKRVRLARKLLSQVLIQVDVVVDPTRTTTAASRCWWERSSSASFLRRMPTSGLASVCSSPVPRQGLAPRSPGSSLRVVRACLPAPCYGAELTLLFPMLHGRRTPRDRGPARGPPC